MKDVKSGHKQSSSITASILGSGTSGLLELLIFHPFDTIIKRSMSNEKKINVSESFSTRMKGFYSVAFRDSANLSFLKKVQSLYFGFSYAVGYKVLQRIYKFGMQPLVKEIVDKNGGHFFVKNFGKHSDWVNFKFNLRLWMV